MLEKDPEKRATASSLCEDEWLTKDKPVELFMVAELKDQSEISEYISSPEAYQKCSLESLSECLSEDSCSLSSKSEKNECDTP
jgi:hypothetical protein